MSINRLEQLKKMLEESPKDSFLLFAMAKEFENSERPLEALSLYKKLIQTDPDYVGTYYHIGKLCEMLSKDGEAISYYEQGLKVAQKIKDDHSYRELSAAKYNLEIQ